MAEEKKLPDDFDWRAFTPEDSPKTPMDVMSDPVHRDLGTSSLKEGDDAYDFKSNIYDYSDGTEQSTGNVFHLAEAAREKPVALIFGSYT
jgi:hypothetical protein